MNPSYYILIGCLVIAVVLTAVVEGRLSRRISENTQMRLAWAAFFSCYGVCVAILSLLLSHLFGLREWLPILAAVPLGVL